uniref:Uncharacterized protein n=1 Tax=Oryza punctata TaxID=4537 RepID=A0A0E0M5I9_ORYPU
MHGGQEGTYPLPSSYPSLFLAPLTHLSSPLVPYPPFLISLPSLLAAYNGDGGRSHIRRWQQSADPMLAEDPVADAMLAAGGAVSVASVTGSTASAAGRSSVGGGHDTIAVLAPLATTLGEVDDAVEGATVAPGSGSAATGSGLRGVGSEQDNAVETSVEEGNGDQRGLGDNNVGLGDSNGWA